MFQKKKILAFIGARSGSKGLKNKNIINFAGKPLIEWTIQAALQSKYIDRVIVSTDSFKIAAVSKKSGADVPFIRPKNIAQDTSSIYDAIHHCIQWLEQHEKTIYDYLLLLMPTSPLRTSKHIDEAIHYYFRNKQSNQDTLVSVQQLSQKMGFLMAPTHLNYIDFCFKVSRKNPQRQNNKNYYLPNGVIYMAPIKVVKKMSFYTTKTLYFVMKEEDSIDIDTRDDLLQALKIYYKKIAQYKYFLSMILK